MIPLQPSRHSIRTSVRFFLPPPGPPCPTSLSKKSSNRIRDPRGAGDVEALVQHEGRRGAVPGGEGRRGVGHAQPAVGEGGPVRLPLRRSTPAVGCLGENAGLESASWVKNGGHPKMTDTLAELCRGHEDRRFLPPPRKACGNFGLLTGYPLYHIDLPHM